jgi:hypothetical protein
MEEKEIRTLPASLRIEQRADGKGKKIVGYASIFNELSEDLGGFKERIKPGAFTEVLKNSDARALMNHDPNLILGRESAGTLRLKEDKKGLLMEIDPPDTQVASDLMKSIERGDIREQSFAFRVEADQWEGLDDQDKETIRTILEVSHLYDVSPVTYPAYPQTSAALRSMELAKGQEADDSILDDLLENDLSDDLLADI